MYKWWVLRTQIGQYAHLQQCIRLTIRALIIGSVLDTNDKAKFTIAASISDMQDSA